MKHMLTACLLAILALAGCSESVMRDDTSRILLVGDSLLAANGALRKSVSHEVERQLGQEVIDRAVPGARMIYGLPVSGAAGLNIPKQYRKGDWDWVIVNGGGNDLWLGCGCSFCARKMNRLISHDGAQGVIPDFVSKIRKTGAKVIYVGYLRSPGLGSPIEYCRDEGDELERRIDVLAGQDTGVYFLSISDLVPYGDRSFHGIDMIHPSAKASTAIGQRLAALMTGGTPAPETPTGDDAE